MLICLFIEISIRIMRMFFGLCCAGVEHGYSDQRQGEGHVETCRADRPRVAKGGREAWTEGPRHAGWQGNG